MRWFTEPLKEMADYRHLLENIKKRMLALNAKHALMTGSGSAVIGLFKDKNDQKEASSDHELSEAGDVIIAETLGKEELKS